jgi:D-alanyl-D-alanine carboxypeptidase
VLWQREPGRRLPIASLTKMLTALIIAKRDRPSRC